MTAAIHSENWYFKKTNIFHYFPSKNLKYSQIFLSETIHAQESGSRGPHFAKSLNSNFLKGLTYSECFTLQYFQSSFDQDLFDIPWNWSKLEYVDGFCSPTKDFQRELCQQPWEESQPRTSQSSSPHRQCWGREENGQLCLQLVCIVKTQLCHNDFKHCESESSSSHLQRHVWSQFVGFCSDETYI